MSYRFATILFFGLLVSKAFALQDKVSVQVTRQVHRVEVLIGGLACPYCVFNIKKRLRALKEIDRGHRIDVSLESGKVVFAWIAG